MVLQLLLTLESNATATAKSKGQNFQCTWATKLRGRDLYMILSKRDRLIIAHVTYAWYIRESASTFQMHSCLSINTAYTSPQPYNKLSNFKIYKTHAFTSERLQILPEMVQNWRETLGERRGGPVKARPEVEGINNPYQAGIIDSPVIPNVLDEFSSKLLAIDAVGFSLNVAFRGYQIWPNSIVWKGRYMRNKAGPYHDPGYSVLQY